MNKGVFWKGLRDGLPICMGYFAVSFAFGIQAAAAGLTAFQAGLLSLLNLTSAGQFAGLGVIAAAGSYIEMAALQLVINLRYLLMSAALSQKVEPKTGTVSRLMMAYGVTDEVFGVSVLVDGTLYPRYSYGLIAIATFGWVAGTALGASAGAVLPDRIISALGIALYGMFLAVILPPAKKERPVTVAVLSAMALSTLCAVVPGVRALSSGMRIILVTVAVAAFCAAKWPVKEQ
ncbi:MAG: AzlC family ABC transporter permease [Clostridia bacterium]|nr:AzlC family ABC transporter permease [Clostridia bacterium]MBQ8973927.1 AzlC family ABC transporter permease [Clostridia bacterium]